MVLVSTARLRFRTGRSRFSTTRRRQPAAPTPEAPFALHRGHTPVSAGSAVPAGLRTAFRVRAQSEERTCRRADSLRRRCRRVRLGSGTPRSPPRRCRGPVRAGPGASRSRPRSQRPVACAGSAAAEPPRTTAKPKKIPPTRRRRSRGAGLGALSHGTVPSNHWPLVRVSRGPFGIRDRMATATSCPARGRADDPPCLTRLPRPVERFRAPLLARSPPGAQVTDQRCRSQCLNQTQPARQRSPVLPGATSSPPQNGDEQNVRLGGDGLGRPRQGPGGFPGAGSRSRRLAASGRSNSAQP